MRSDKDHTYFVAGVPVELLGLLDKTLVSLNTKDDKTLCKCGCGRRPIGRSAYHAGCFAVVGRCKTRLWNLQQYAKRKKIQFDLTINDILELLRDLPDTGDMVSIERADTNIGFSKGNLILRKHKGRPPNTKRLAARRGPSKKRVIRLLERLVSKQLAMIFKSSRPPVTEEDVIRIYATQGGRCAVTGELLVLDAPRHPSSMSIARMEPSEPWSKENIIITTLTARTFVEAYGYKTMIETSVAAVKRLKKLKKDK